MIGQGEGHFKRNPSRQGSSIKLLSSSSPSPTLFDMPPMFATDLSNRSNTDLFPVVTGQHAHAIFTLDHVVGMITQTNTRVFSH